MRLRARVLRATGGVDEWGTPRADAVPDVHYDALACHAWQLTDTHEVLAGSAGAFGMVRLMVPLDSDVLESDTIEDVRDRLGRVVFQGPLRILGVSRRLDHLLIDARVSKGGAV